MELDGGAGALAHEVRTSVSTKGGLVTTNTSGRPRTSTRTSAPSWIWELISARATPLRKVGENVPDVTWPIGRSLVTFFFKYG